MQFLTGLLLVSLVQAPAADPLARARQAYNNRQFDAAVTAAREASRTPATANAGAVVLARALLERYRAGADAADLEAARTALGTVRFDLLSPADRGEYFLGFGISFYLEGCADGCYSTAAEFFDLALAGGAALDAPARESIFEWWANALDHQAQYAPDEERPPIYRRILDRAEAERNRDLNSTSAFYWVAAASRGVGDFNRAWGAAVAGWIRAKYLGPRGEALRSDLTFFVTQVLLPERVRQMPPEGDRLATLQGLRKQWEEIQNKYRQ